MPAEPRTRLPADLSKRQLIKDGAALGAAAAVTALGFRGQPGILLPMAPSAPLLVPGTLNGVYPVTFSNSAASSAWQNDKEGEPMKASDFPGPGYGAQGDIKGLPIIGIADHVVVFHLDQAKVAPTMRGVIAPGFAAFNAKCTHLGCTALWRDEAEAKRIVPVTPGHDFVVDPCHLSSFDPYDSGKVLFGPAPRPLEQLKLRIDGDLVKIEFTNYKFGGGTPQV